MAGQASDDELAGIKVSPQGLPPGNGVYDLQQTVHSAHAGLEHLTPRLLASFAQAQQGVESELPDGVEEASTPSTPGAGHAAGVTPQVVESVGVQDTTAIHASKKQGFQAPVGAAALASRPSPDGAVRNSTHEGVVPPEELSLDAVEAPKRHAALAPLQQPSRIAQPRPATLSGQVVGAIKNLFHLPGKLLRYANSALGAALSQVLDSWRHAQIATQTAAPASVASAELVPDALRRGAAASHAPLISTQGTSLENRSSLPPIDASRIKAPVGPSANNLLRQSQAQGMNRAR